VTKARQKARQQTRKAVAGFDPLARYKEKRDFQKTSEPGGKRGRLRKRALAYAVQKHDATRTHFDFRLEWKGTLMSWAIPKGPSENPGDKRLAVHVEDHPVEYGSFEGTIPQGEYGGGTVMLWDQGTWEPQEESADVDEALAKGKLAFLLHGERLKGKWAFVRLRKRSPKDKDNWLLIKELDDYVDREGKPSPEREFTSVKTGREMDEIAEGKKLGKEVWHSHKVARGAPNRDPEIVASSGKRPGNRSKKIPPPAFVTPALATLVDAPPAGSEWLHEIKYDGYRAVTSIGSERVVIRTRSGLDWTEKFSSLVPALQALPCDSAVLDGEIAVTDAKGHTNFGALQDALGDEGGGKGKLVYYLFDLLHLDGKDLRNTPLLDRKKKLKALLGAAKSPLFYSDHIAGSGGKMFSQACSMQLEGIISKRADAPYRSGRGKAWLKIKCGMEQEFLIIGWRPSDKASRPFSSLLLAVREKGKLRYAGRVGSGYTGDRLDDLAVQFKKLARKTPPVDGVPREIMRDAHFIEPELVAEIAFRGWTNDGVVRQGSFKGLRSDKPAKEIVREREAPVDMVVRAAVKAEQPKKKSAVKTAHDGAEEIEGVRVTHPDRVMFADDNVTKQDVIDHYLAVADRILPHVANRPLSLVRCPDGTGEKCFFQKHASGGFPDALKKVPIRDKGGKEDYLYIDDVQGLIAAVQMSGLELHVWGSRVDDVERPDRMVFDFDPDEGLGFAKVREAARDMRIRLKKVGLESFPMVTGGKGIHVVVPLIRGHSWDQHRDFSEAFARVMAEQEPERYVANMSKAKRKGRIFIDYLRNQRGATAIAPFSTRARAHATVAVPVSWQELGKLKNAHPANVGNAAKFARGRDPWPGYFKLKQELPSFRDGP
jgi:bifunctional non-homologous end joining protein LigD